MKAMMEICKYCKYQFTRNRVNHKSESRLIDHFPLERFFVIAGNAPTDRDIWAESGEMLSGDPKAKGALSHELC